MATDRAPRRVGAAWPVLAGVGVLVLIGGTVYLRWPGRGEVTPASLPSATLPAQPTPSAAAKPAAPSFDVVRVTPEGHTVIAGRAEPGAQVVVRDGETTLGQVLADRHGAFVLIPDKSLAPGGRELTLTSREAGGPEVKGEETVVVVVPAPPTASALPTAPVAVLVPSGGGTSRLLQAPQSADRKQLAMSTVDYDDKGEIRLSGTAAPSTPLRFYVDNLPAGDATSDANGQWTLTPHSTVALGLHRFRVDQLAPGGRVARRIELPFQRTAATPGEVAQGRVVVQPGQNLWRIARYAYGSGLRYTAIFLANRDQIRDPRLIYPGQVFATPQ